MYLVEAYKSGKSFKLPHWNFVLTEYDTLDDITIEDAVSDEWVTEESTPEVRINQLEDELKAIEKRLVELETIALKVDKKFRSLTEVVNSLSSYKISSEEKDSCVCGGDCGC